MRQLEAMWVRLAVGRYALQAEGLRLEIERDPGPRPWVWQVRTIDFAGLLYQGRARSVAEAKRLAVTYGHRAKARHDSDE